MKKLITTTFAFTFLTLSPTAQTQYGMSQSSDQCTDINCYYSQREQMMERDRQEEQQKLERYYTQQIEVQRAQLQEIQKQNDLFEERLQEMDNREAQLQQYEERRELQESILYEQDTKEAVE